MHLEQFALIVNDYDDAIRFFVDVLGFELVEDSPSLTNDGRPKRWVVVRPPGATTALLLAQADGDRQARAVGDQFAGRVGLFLRVDDFDSSLERMRAAGVEFVIEPRNEPYGQVAVFLDVAGNRWDLLGPRPFPLTHLVRRDVAFVDQAVAPASGSMLLAGVIECFSASHLAARTDNGAGRVPLEILSGAPSARVLLQVGRFARSRPDLDLSRPYGGASAPPRGLPPDEEDLRDEDRPTRHGLRSRSRRHLPPPSRRR